ncbi:MAG: hypothetical protein J3Q66DRAFT_338391, partial [Benniella sp.]
MQPFFSFVAALLVAWTYYTHTHTYTLTHGRTIVRLLKRGARQIRQKSEKKKRRIWIPCIPIKMEKLFLLRNRSAVGQVVFFADCYPIRGFTLGCMYVYGGCKTL